MYKKGEGATEYGIHSIFSTVSHAVESCISGNYQGLPQIFDLLDQLLLIRFPVQVNGGEKTQLKMTDEHHILETS